jgi:hypothetical protein
VLGLAVYYMPHGVWVAPDNSMDGQTPPPLPQLHVTTGSLIGVGYYRVEDIFPAVIEHKLTRMAMSACQVL